MKTQVLFILLTSLWSIKGHCQVTDTLQDPRNVSFQYKSLIIPAALISYGVIGIESDVIKSFNVETKQEVNEHIDEKRTIDDFTQHFGYVSVYSLNALGVKGKNNFRDRTVILATSYAIMASTVLSLKSMTNIKRPDGSADNSFPSGHTATAFVGAEFLYQEYKDKSAWYGIAGYVVATGTGLFRVYNDRHWVTDIAAGAGIGILSTKIAYWINPLFKRILFKSDPGKTTGVLLYPSYNKQQFEIGLAFNF